MIWLFACSVAVATALGSPGIPVGLLPPRHNPQQHATDDGPSIGFDDALNASADGPQLRGLVDASAIKSREDKGIPRLANAPQLTLMPGARVVPEGNRGFELQATATQAWNLEGYGKQRRATAAAEGAALDAETRALALQGRLAAARVWIQLHGAEREQALAQQQLELARERETMIEEAVAAGVGRSVDAAAAAADRAEALSSLTELDGIVHDLGLILARETSAAGDTPLTTSGEYPRPELPPTTELARRFADVQNLPAVVTRRLQARAMRAAATEGVSSRGRQLITGVSVQREATSDLSVFGVIGISLAGDRGQRQYSSALAQARALEGEADQQVNDLQAVLSTAVHELHHASEREQILREHVVPSVNALVEARREALSLGEGTGSELLLAQARQIAAHRRLAEAEALTVWARVEAWLYLQALTTEETTPSEQP